MNQRGFVMSPLLWQLVYYAIGALAVVGAMTYVYQLVDNSWATDAGIAEGRKQAEDELKPALAACNASLLAQNQAVAALGAAGKARQARAMAGVKEAEKRAKTAQNEAQRLREAILAPVDKSCDAAVEVVRRGLLQ